MNFSKEFRNPPREYSTVPLWFWNGTLEKETLEKQLTDMADKGIYGAFMHARAYLKTPYLEKEWWDAVKACVEKGKEIGFSTWIYDEYAWPSGTAGSTFEYGFQRPSRVLNGKPSNMAKGLLFKEIILDRLTKLEEIEEEKDLELLGIYFKRETRHEMKFIRFASKEEIDKTFLQEAIKRQMPIVLCYIQTFPGSVDYLNKKTIQEFISETHEKYKEQAGLEFGRTIPGIFFDEIYMESPEFSWTDELPDIFKRQWGYDLVEKLPLLLADNNSGKNLRMDYFKVIAGMYEDAFFKQISDWCKANNLMLTGHTEEELAFHPRRQGNYFSTMRHLQIPGADCHDYRYRLPRKISIQEPKYSVSVARAYGKKRALSEALGGAGWGCSLQEYKRGIHTLAAMGINFFCLHGMYYECEHQGSQADWPASFFYQNPYWKYFKIFADEIRRISFVNSLGNPVVENALFYPITDMQANIIGRDPNGVNKAIEEAFHKVLRNMVEHQADIDLIDEDSLLASEIEEGCIISGERRLKNLFIHEDARMSQKLKDRLNSFIKNGGHIFYYKWKKNSLHIDPDYIYDRYVQVQIPDIKIIKGDYDEIYTNHRKFENMDFYFVTNSDDKVKEIDIAFRCTGRVSEWYPEYGQKGFIKYTKTGEYTIMHLSLKEDEAVYLIFEQTEEMESQPYNGDNQLPEIKGKEGMEAKGYQTVTGRWEILPLEKIYDEKWDISAKESRLFLPIALFSSELQMESFQIRILNTPWEKGACGRHLSLWNASWITRRHHWNDCMMLKDLYFRKRITLPSAPGKASICIAAVNQFTIYINGLEVLKAVSNCKPEIVQIGAFLKKGDNLVAVQVHNDNPFMSPNFAEEETVPKDRMISLLLEGKIECGTSQIQLLSDSSWIVTGKETADWMQPEADYENQAMEHDSSKYIPPAKEEVWLYAWERGKPPLLPWGNLPLFDKIPEFPLNIHYTIVIPCGTARIRKPEVAGEAAYTLDGNEIFWKEESVFYDNRIGRTELCKNNNDKTGKRSYIDMKPCNYTRIFQINVKVYNGGQGLKSPVEIIMKPFKDGFGEWSKIGMPWFSGRVLYKNTFMNWMDKRNQEYYNSNHKQFYRYKISLGKVFQCAEIWINGNLAGTRVWEPYELEITNYVKEGENEIVIVVANSAAPERRCMLVDEGMAVAWNRYWNEDNIDRESEDLISGLMGPVRIYRYLTIQEIPAPFCEA